MYIRNDYDIYKYSELSNKGKNHKYNEFVLFADIEQTTVARYFLS